MNKTYWYQVCDNEGHTHHVRYKRFICEAKEEEGRIAEMCSAKSMFLKSVTTTYFKLKFTHDLRCLPSKCPTRTPTPDQNSRELFNQDGVCLCAS